MGALSAIIHKIKFSRNPVEYCRSLGVDIGDGCIILGTSQPFGSEPYLVTVGNYCRINAGVQFITHDGSVWVLRNLKKQEKVDLNIEPEYYTEDIDLFGPIKIGNNVQIGSNSLILPGVTIGNNVIIGAGAIVTKDIPSNSVAVGVPAKVIESIEDYFWKNKERFDHTKKLEAEAKRNYLTQKYSNGDC